MIKILDESTLQKVGMENDVERNHVADVINGCTVLIGPERNNSLVLFGRSLKRKVEEIDTIIEDNNRLVAESRRNDDEYSAAIRSTEQLTKTNEDLVAQIDTQNQTIARLTEEAKDLRKIQKEAGKTTGHLHEKISALSNENAALHESWQTRFVALKTEKGQIKRQLDAITGKATKCKQTLERKTSELARLQLELKAKESSFQTTLDEREATMIELSNAGHESRRNLESAHAEITGLKHELQELRSELSTKTLQLSTMEASNDEFMRVTRSDIHEEYKAAFNTMHDALCRIQSMPTFRDKTNGYQSSCPVPTRTGYIDSLLNIMLQWISTPCDNEGEVHASFRCPISGFATSIASSEQMNLIRSIAIDTGICTNPPFYLQFLDPVGDAWTEFTFTEQVGMISKVCKIYRRKMVDSASDHLVVAGGNMLLTFHLYHTAEAQWTLAFNLKSLVSADPPPRVRIIITDPFPFDGLIFAYVADQPDDAPPSPDANNL